MSGIVYCEGRFVSEGEARIGSLDCGLTPAERLLHIKAVRLPSTQRSCPRIPSN